MVAQRQKSNPAHNALHLVALEAKAAALSRVMATIEFNLDGTVVDANQNFLALMGYEREQIVGRHHRIFVDPADAATPEYVLFWDRLRAGEPHTAQFRRITRTGEDVWLEASYTPLLDPHGKPWGVIKIATDITARKQRELEVTSELAALSKAMAVIEFGLDGTILRANDNFLSVLGYEAKDVVGRHHRMFVDPAYGASDAYAQFWSELRAGKEQKAEFVRFGKDGRRVVIQAVYSPILDMKGKPFKVVKYATDMTEQRAKDDESRQIRNALDSSRTNMMVANERFEVTYVNESMHRLLTEAEAEIRVALPHFRADAVVGSSIDSFHAQPEHTRQMLMGLTGHHGVRITLGAKVFDLGISAARNGDKIVGFAVEWVDVSERLHEENVVQKEVARVVAAAVEGDLRDRIDVSAFRPGFLRDVSERINVMLSSLNDALAAVKSTTAEIGQAATQFRATSRLMAGSAEQLTSAASTSSSTLAEVSLAVGDNAESAASAQAVVRTMAGAVNESSARMLELRAAMSSISTSSEQVISIIKVIDEIAFQTNLLALNAAIEAARAGRHGKGFAVVAQEVRSLAVRSADAARESARLIEGAVARVGEGVVVAQLTEAALNDITTNVERAVTFVSNIAASSRQQSRSLVDVNAAVSQVSSGAQAGSQQSIEVAVASEQLARQTEVLLQRTDRYQVSPPSVALVDAPSPALLAEIAELVRRHTPLRRAS